MNSISNKQTKKKTLNRSFLTQHTTDRLQYKKVVTILKDKIPVNYNVNPMSMNIKLNIFSMFLDTVSILGCS